MGLNETFTGLGVAIGPPLGGLLFSLGGFWCPFVTLACSLLPGVLFIHVAFRPAAGATADDDGDDDDDDESSVSVLDVLRIPQVALIVAACVLDESALTFVMPTFAEHALATGLASTPAAIGVYFTANALLYTIAAPTVGLFTTPGNARRMIVGGLTLTSVACFFFGPSAWLLPVLDALPLALPIPAAVLFGFALLGIGEGMAMAPLMEDMMVSCGRQGDAYINSLSSVMAASFALGEVVGPMVGTNLTALVGFHSATTALGLVLTAYTVLLALFGGRLRGSEELPQGEGKTVSAVADAALSPPTAADDGDGDRVGELPVGRRSRRSRVSTSELQLSRSKRVSSRRASLGAWSSRLSLTER